jgi:hypothetical protein
MVVSEEDIRRALIIKRLDEQLKFHREELKKARTNTEEFSASSRIAIELLLLDQLGYIKFGIRGLEE